MINLVQNAITQINYHWNEPKTYLVLVPVISLIIYETQIKDIFSNLDANNVAAKKAKWHAVFKCHLIGSGVQMIVASAIAIYVHPVFLLFTLLAFGECYKNFIDTSSAQSVAFLNNPALNTCLSFWG